MAICLVLCSSTFDFLRQRHLKFAVCNEYTPCLMPVVKGLSPDLLWTTLISNDLLSLYWLLFVGVTITTNLVAQKYMNLVQCGGAHV